MNGRVYDPALSRFLSVDPFIQAPGMAMSFNRYAYCLNNPFLYNDPSGYKWNWNWLNPVHWLSEGMQWINDKTVKLRKKMTKIGVPDFSVGAYTKGGHWNARADYKGHEVFNTYNHRVMKGVATVDGEWNGKVRSAVASGQVAGSPASSGAYESSSLLRKGMYWGDALLRMKYNLPADAYSIAGNIDIIGLAGADFSIPGKLLVVNGPDIGKSKNVFDYGIAAGLDVGISGVVTSYYFVGDVNQMKIGDFEGTRWAISIGFSWGIEIGGGYLVAPVPGKGYIIGKMNHVGLSPAGPSGNILTFPMSITQLLEASFLLA